MPCENCGAPIPFEEFLKSLIKIDADGNYGININLIAVDCNDLTDAAVCGSINDLGEMLKKTCTLDDCDNVQINVFYQAQN